ncbi:hypothetical protein Q3G72_027555 [Acer saccharum]|nr:hypothetical protein Q3G72_027555 [Acer saccharum]
MIVLLGACSQQASENKILPISQVISHCSYAVEWTIYCGSKYHSLQTDLYCDPILGAKLHFCVILCCGAATGAGISRIDNSTVKVGCDDFVNRTSLPLSRCPDQLKMFWPPPDWLALAMSCGSMSQPFFFLLDPVINQFIVNLICNLRAYLKLLYAYQLLQPLLL